MNAACRQIVFAVFALCFCAVFSPAQANAARVEYTEAAFQSAVQSGKPVALQFHASWCPTCKLQEKSLEAVLKDPAYADVTVYAADFDTAEALLTKYKATTQGTIILFRDGKEVNRSVGETDEAKLREFLAPAAGKK